MFCFNTKGLRSHWDSFIYLINDMHGSSINEAFDILGVTELYGMTSGECNLSGYHPIIFNTRQDTSYSRGGVGLYIKDSFRVTVRTALSTCIPHIFESIFVGTACFTTT